jgi:hypothetical protein
MRLTAIGPGVRGHSAAAAVLPRRVASSRLLSWRGWHAVLWINRDGPASQHGQRPITAAAVGQACDGMLEVALSHDSSCAGSLQSLDAIRQPIQTALQKAGHIPFGSISWVGPGWVSRQTCVHMSGPWIHTTAMAAGLNMPLHRKQQQTISHSGMQPGAHVRRLQ